MAKIHHIFINYNVLTNNFHTYQLFTSSSPLPLPIVFPILAPPFLPSPPRFLAISVSLSCYLLRPVLLSSPRCLAVFISLSCQLFCSVLVSHMPRTCKHFSSLSNPAHALLRSRKGPSTSKNMPFLMQEKPLLDARKAYSRPVLITI